MDTMDICGSILEIDRYAWERLSGGNAFMSYGWLKTYESTASGQGTAQYFLLREGAEIVAAAVGYVCRKEPRETILDGCLLGRARPYARKLGLSFLPALLCGPARGYGAHFLVSNHASPLQKKARMESLLRSMEQEVLTGRHLSMAFSSVMDNEPELIQLLEENGYHKTFNFPYNYLDIRWQSFEAYKAYARSRTPSIKRTINHEINRNRKAGVMIRRMDDISGCEDRLYRLLADNFGKYNPGAAFPFQKHFLSELAQNLGREAIIYVAFKGGDIVAVCVGMLRNGAIYLPMVGVDHEKTGNDFTYFNIGYYRPIEDAIAWGAKRVFFGNALYQMKARRGCDIASAYIFYKSAGLISDPMARLWFALHASWYKKKLPNAARMPAAGIEFR